MKFFSRAPQSVAQLVERFIATGTGLPDIVGPGDVRGYDKADSAMRDIAKQLQARGAEGEEALLTLMDHKHAVVRMRAAAACLNVSRDRAVNVLADICDLRAGKVSMDAMHALLFADEFDLETGPKRRPV